MWQPTSLDLQCGAESLHSTPWDVAPGHLEVVKGAEFAKGAAKSIPYVLLRMGSGVNPSLEGSGWTTLSKLAVLTVLGITCEVSVSVDEPVWLFTSPPTGEIPPMIKVLSCTGEKLVSMRSFGSFSESIRPPDDHDIQGEIHQE